jgi:hypothetical protein
MSNEIRQMIDKVKNFKPLIKEDEGKNKIEITKTEPDERLGKESNTFEVNYQVIVNDKIIEITGVLTPYHSGRSIEYKFEPNNLSDDETELYYDNNWEQIEEEILDKFSEVSNTIN